MFALLHYYTSWLETSQAGGIVHQYINTVTSKQIRRAGCDERAVHPRYGHVYVRRERLGSLRQPASITTTTTCG